MLAVLGMVAASGSRLVALDLGDWQQRAVDLVISLSRGLSECIHSGRKSQFLSHRGRWVGLCDCSRFTKMMKEATPANGAPTPTMACHPAIERPKTRAGRSRKQSRR